jgi:hypothetical protein
MGDPTWLSLLKKKFKGAADLSPALIFFYKESDMLIVSNQILTIIVTEKEHLRETSLIEITIDIFVA